VQATEPPKYKQYEGYCWVCFRRPLVGLQTPLGLEYTGLCGSCFFTDKARHDPETWNEKENDDENTVC
jgi:hypothetical protein